MSYSLQKNKHPLEKDGQHKKDEYDISVQKQYIYQMLKEKGCRVTSQRKVIIDIILRNHFTCIKEIYYEASAVDPSIGIATVYRMMKTLEDIGAIDRTNMYKISYDPKCPMKDVCVIEFTDQSRLNISAREWTAVVREGLKACGHLRNREIMSITMKECLCCNEECKL